jgi:peptide/nickel transport system permease protein
MDFLRRRILISIIVFFVAINLDFILPRLVPGNAAQIFASGTKLPQEAVQLLSARFGLNQPVYVQYLLFLKGIFLTWPPDFGVSYQFYPQTVSCLILIRLPWTVLLIVSSLFLSFQIGYLLAALSSLRRGSKLEFGSLYTSILLWATPAFWIGMILIWTFGVYLGWLPIFGNVDFGLGWGPQFVYSVFIHAILPIATLTLVVFGQNYFILRGAAQETLKSDYVFTAKARGLRKRVVAFGYVLRNSLIPSMSLLGYSIANLISAVILVEFVYGYTGLGDLIVDAIINRDYPVIEGSFFYITIIVIIGGLIGDFLILKLDPRLRKK